VDVRSIADGVRRRARGSQLWRLPGRAETWPKPYVGSGRIDRRRTPRRAALALHARSWAGHAPHLARTKLDLDRSVSLVASAAARAVRTVGRYNLGFCFGISISRPSAVPERGETCGGGMLPPTSCCPAAGIQWRCLPPSRPILLVTILLIVTTPKRFTEIIEYLICLGTLSKFFSTEANVLPSSVN
jgi:hypothetical protein